MTAQQRGTKALAQDIVGRVTDPEPSAAPRDLNALARLLGARDILYRTRVHHGYTEWTSRGPTIQIAIANTDGRRRATLAHECGHLLLDPLFNPPAFQRAPFSGQVRQRHHTHTMLGPVALAVQRGAPHLDLEDLCDDVAIELLLPAALMPGLQQRVQSVDDLRQLANERRVSLAMLVIRLNEFGSGHALLHLQRARSGTWLVSTAIGVPQAWRGRVVSSDLGSDKGRPRQHDGQLSLHTRDRNVDIQGSVARLDADRALVLLPAAQLYGQRSRPMMPHQARRPGPPPQERDLLPKS